MRRFLMMPWFKILSRGMLISVFVFALAVGSAHAHENCLGYEPATVKLKGKIFRQTFAGRPNYESVKAGDEPETVWILQLPQPVCVESTLGGEGKGNYYENEKMVRRVQLVLTSEQYTRWRKWSNRHGGQVIAEGTLFHSFTGHHHTRVLLTVADLKGV